MKLSKELLPSDWKIVRLGDYVVSEKGKKPKKTSKSKTEECSIPYVDIQAFEENIVSNWTDGVGARKCFESDFLMVWDGSRSGLVGKGIDGALGSTLVRINFPNINNTYAYYFLRSKYYEINTRAKGSGTPHVDPDLLWNYDFPIAPLSKQAEVVGKIEELFSELNVAESHFKAAKERLNLYRQSILEKAFSGNLTASWRKKNNLSNVNDLLKDIKSFYNRQYELELSAHKLSGGGKRPRKQKLIGEINADLLKKLPQIPDDWKWVRIADVAIVGTGVTPLKSNKSFYENGDIAWVTSGALNSSFVYEATDFVTQTAYKDTNLRLYPPHTLLLAMYGEGKTRGKCSELMISATTNQAIAAINLSGEAEYLRTYLKWFLQKNYESIRTKSSGGVQPNLNVDIVENTLLPLCSKEEANYIVQELEAKLSDIEHIKNTVDSQLEKIEHVKYSILKSAFSGKLVS